MRLIIILDSRNSISLNIKPENHISDIKNEITQIKGIPFDQQQLLYNGKCLDNNNIIEKCSINDDSTLILNIENKKILVFVCIGSKSIPLLIDPDHSIKELKNAIYEKIGLQPNNQTLFYHHKKLEDMYSLADYSIQKFARIHIIQKE